MIVFDPTTWTISLPPGESPIARQYDNMTRSLTVTGVPDGWDWTLLVQAQGKLDLIDLEPVEGGVGVTLTAQMLALAGFYTIQLRGTQGDLVRHTNVLQVLVPKSLSGSATWPTVPSAVEQVLQQTAELNQHPPYPGDNGYWMVWDLDTHAYVESQLPLPPVAEGPAGKDATITVGETITGEPGKPASVQNTGTESAAVLDFTLPAGETGAGVPPTDGVPDNYVLTPAGWAEPTGKGNTEYRLLSSIQLDQPADVINADGFDVHELIVFFALKTTDNLTPVFLLNSNWSTGGVYINLEPNISPANYYQKYIAQAFADGGNAYAFRIGVTPQSNVMSQQIGVASYNSITSVALNKIGDGQYASGSAMIVYGR